MPTLYLREISERRQWPTAATILGKKGKSSAERLAPNTKLNQDSAEALFTEEGHQAKLKELLQRKNTERTEKQCPSGSDKLEAVSGQINKKAGLPRCARKDGIRATRQHPLSL